MAKLIEPVYLTDARLIGSDVPEDDYQEWVAGDPYTVGDNVMVTTPNIHKNYECIVSVEAGLDPDLLEEYCNDFTTNSWTDADYHGATTSISPAGQFEFDSGLEVNNPYASVSKNLGSPPNTFTIEVKVYFDALGASGDGDHAYLSYQSGTWSFLVQFSCIGGGTTGKIAVFSGSGSAEVGTDEVKCNAGAAWQTWRFEVTKTVEADATCDVYLKNEGEAVFTQIGTAIDCDKVDTYTDGLFYWRQYGNATDHRISHVDTFKVATGLGNVSTIEDSPENNSTKWLELESTNRWAAFDTKVGSQTEQAEALTFVIAPGTAIDSMGFLNIAADTIDVVEIDTTGDLVTNGTAWTGATGTTEPDDWDKVGDPADYAIDDGMCKITTDAVNEGMSQTITVTAGTEYQLLGLYKNTDGDTAQYAVYDVTNSDDILVTTDLASSTVNSVFSYVFTAPAGCESVKISFLGKASGDIVWFDTVRLAPTTYNETINMVPTGTLQITDAAIFDLVSSATAVYTITFAYSGGTVAVGGIIMGVQAYLGKTQYSTSSGIHDYSTKETDAFGVSSILERAYSKTMSVEIKVLAASKNYVQNLLASYRATPVLYVGDEDDPTLIIYGWFKDFSIITNFPAFAICSIEVEGLT